MSVAVTFRLDRNAANSAVGKAVAKSVRDTANFVRRTERAAVGQPAPQIRLGQGGRVYRGSSMPGDPPFRRTGRLYGSVGFDFQSRRASVESTGRVSVASYGLELGTGKIAPRPSLGPIVEANLSTIRAGLEGRPLPKIGSIARAARRKPQKQKVDYRGRKRTAISYEPGLSQTRKPRR